MIRNAKAPKHLNQSGPFLRRELARFYSAIDTNLERRPVFVVNGQQYSNISYVDFALVLDPLLS